MKRVNGGYILVLDVPNRVRVHVGKLGKFTLTRGTYLYGGSARNGIAARIRRHLNGGNSVYWHIDYLTSREEIQIPEVWCYPDQPGIEHQLAGHKMTDHQGLLNGFGNSDCSSGCQSHLWKKTGEILPEDFSERYYIVRNDIG